ncbi:aldehyde dehydrogenase [Kordiimonas sediminis]|uniref:Aldehyde dehydrogenase n=1 Tax=Kordiimonas sediminis TaxID=1735581 RepID=A0A919E432_9PROT|nr:aldehyde dehydrogenase family protein [Kordiimonas sediminis]GHF10943.1 aldehyde dehydrogenase [Kordiimonas sediminis]
MSDYKLWIDGKATEGASNLDVVNPATEKVFASIARSDTALADKAIASAKAAQKIWAKTAIADRQVALNKIADALNANADKIARVLTQEQGKPIAEASAEVMYTEAFIRYFATMDLPVEVLQDDDAKRVELYRKPLGVVACIIPWNFPLLIIAFKVPLALLAGNSCVIKPSPTTPLTAALFAEICADILPAGVINTVNDDNDLGGYLTQHADVAKVSFTGSTETGKKVMASAANTLKRLTLELGGNDPAIVLPDVNVAETAAKMYGAAFMNCGQVCLALKRAYVHESIYDEMCDELAKLAKAAIVGDGLEQGTQIGPLNNKMQYEKVKGFLENAKKAGKVIAGGELPDGPGYFIPPTIVRDVKDGDEIVDEEQFGPIMPVIKYTDSDDIIGSANGVDVGLGGSVWSKDIAKAKEIALQVESGTVWINTHLDFGPNIPFGGAKQSGIGVEFAQEGLNEFTQVQVINQAK